MSRPIPFVGRALPEGVARTCEGFAANYDAALAGSRALLRRGEQQAEPQVGAGSSRV